MTKSGLPGVWTSRAIGARTTRPDHQLMVVTEPTLEPTHHQHHLQAQSVGCVALSTLRSASGGYVLGAFKTSLYIALTEPGPVSTSGTMRHQPLICIGAGALMPGPLHVILNVDDQSVVTRTVTTGDPLRACWPQIVIDNAHHQVSIDTRGVVCYASSLPAKADALTSARNIDRLQTQIDRDVCDAPGLKNLAVAEFARPAIDALKTCLRHPPTPEVMSVITRLMGLGQGLTPAGDDVLAGYISALNNLSLHPVIQTHKNSLRQNIREKIPTHTSRISGAHLSCAIDNAQTQGAATTIKLLTQPKPPSVRELQDAIRMLSSIGATSGNDWLAGFCLGVQATQLV